MNHYWKAYTNSVDSLEIYHYLHIFSCLILAHRMLVSVT